MALTKAKIVESVQKQLGISHGNSANIIEALLETMKRTMGNGEDILLSNFGKFCVRQKKERKGRNPATGDSMMINKRRVVTFHSSGKLREKINGE